MAAKDKIKTVYVCSECGETSMRWLGRCPSCGAWNTMTEDVVVPTPPPSAKSPAAIAARAQASTLMAKNLRDISSTEEKSRILTGIKELDRVLGGGIVLGSVILLGGEPGVGKSTMLLQLCGAVATEHSVLYITGEESERQIKLRANRLEIVQDNIQLAAESDVDEICGLIMQTKPDLVIIDSIQTMRCNDIASSSGTVSQIKESTSRFLNVAKTLEIPTFIVGHVNKDGAIAGPKVMEHIVDCVLYFEGDRHSQYRILRCAKNRYGATDEIGMFEMNDRGLAEVPNPSLVMLSGRPLNVSGICVACTMEGSRPLLAEVQGLVSPTAFGNPRRMSTGFDTNRLMLLTAVLEKRAGFFFSNLDTYLNVVGGLWLNEPAADLPVALALMTGLKDKPVPEGVAAFGEIGLAGEIRSVMHAEARVAEAARLGFTTILLPAQDVRAVAPPAGVSVIGAQNVREAFDAIV